MTRKRFIKLAMSHGYSRNEAAELASEVRWYGSYESMYRVVRRYPDLMRCYPDLMHSMTFGFARAFEIISDVCRWAAKAFQSLADSMRSFPGAKEALDE